MLINNRYQLDSLLGAGGMGKVYRATDRLTKTQVALKRVELPSQTTQSTSEQDELRVAISREFRTLATLHHPHIVSVLDYGFDGRYPFFTMTYLPEAQPLDKVFFDKPLPQKINFLVQLLQALAYVHRRGIIHRDLKPANVLVVREQQVQVLDFGLAWEATHSRSQTQQAAGTLLYMAPELFNDALASVASDLYAFGVLAAELLQGYAPFANQNIASLLSKILGGLPDLTDLPTPFLPVVEQLLAKEPAHRLASAEAVIEALCRAANLPLPEESAVLRESYLQSAKFVGRQAELENLRYSLKQLVQEKQGEVWLIGGESGVGKSRLVDEIAIRAQVMGIVTLRGQGVANGGVLYQFWGEPLRRLILTTTLDPTEMSLLKMIIPDIAELLGVELTPLPALDTQTEQAQLLQMVVTIFQRQTQPTLLILEDLQWAQESLAVLRHLAVEIEQMPLLILGTYRDDETADLPHQIPLAQSIKLTRLKREAIEELSEAMLGETGRTPQLLNLLEQETEGNTFFIVEVIRALAEEAGTLADIGRMSLPERVLAGGVQQLIQHRLARVPQDPTSQLLLKLAAVAGRELDKSLLIDGLEKGVFEQWLTVCSNIALLERSETGWRFSHDKFREAILDQLDPAERPMLHRQIAQRLEKLYAHEPAYLALLMEHWYAAGEGEKAVEYGVPTCQQWLDGDQYTQLHLWVERLAPIASLETCAHLLYNHALAYLFEGYATSALKPAQEAFNLIQKFPSAPLYIKILARFYQISFLNNQISFEEFKNNIDEVTELAQNTSDYEGLGWALMIKGVAQSVSGMEREQALNVLEEAYKIGLSINNLHITSFALWHIGQYYRSKNEYGLAEIYFRKANLDAHKSSNLRNILYCTLAIANISSFDQADPLYIKAYSLAQKIGSTSAQLTILSYWIIAIIGQDNFMRAYPLLLKFYGIAKDILNWQGDSRVEFLKLLSFLKAKQEQLEQAIEYLGLGYELTENHFKEGFLKIIKQASNPHSPIGFARLNMADEQFWELFERGRSLKFEDVLADFLAWQPPHPTATTSA